jgi:hypothetical protein
VIFRVLVRFVSVVLVLFVGLLLARAFRRGPRRPAERRPADLPAEDTMVRDRICNTFVPRGRALVAGQGDERQYFCSERCRSQYLERPAAKGVAGA